MLPPPQVEAMRGLLAAVVARGTGRPALSLNRPVFGKTGTTNGNADALFVGFDAQLAVGVWVGRDNRGPIGSQETGSRAALPIWIDFMQAAAPDRVRVAATADYGGRN